MTHVRSSTQVNRDNLTSTEHDHDHPSLFGFNLPFNMETVQHQTSTRTNAGIRLFPLPDMRGLLMPKMTTLQ